MRPVRALSALALIAAALLPAACGGDSTGLAQNDDPNFLRPAAAAPALDASPVSFWAYTDQDGRGEIRYAATGDEQQGEKFLELRVPKGALLRRPDGSAFAATDSILITMQVVDPQRLIVDFEPAGLRFDPAQPALLRMEFGEADGDFNGDGVIDQRDAQIETQLGIWRREQSTQPWTRLTSAVSEELHEVSASISGFTNYAIAY